MKFEGFPASAVRFLRELELNNRRDWFQANKETFRRACREPLEALVAELAGDRESKVFRIHRDVRFSRDKSPYKTWLAAVVDGNYLSLSAEGLYAGGGIYMPEPSTLRRLREAIADEKSGPELEKIVATLVRRGYDVQTHEKLKTAPRGFAKDHPRIELLRHKDLTAGLRWPPGKWLASREPLRRVRKVYRDIQPLRDWFAQRVR